MKFSPEELAQPAPDLRYAPNKLHGDEIQAGDGTTYQPAQPDEWLDGDEVEAFIRRSPAIELLLVDDTANYPPPVYRIAGNTTAAWTRRLSSLYLSDDGLPDPTTGWGLEARRWTTTDGRDVLVFRVSC
ncbi:hypothetical protein OG394_14605 [Kribbella sp. NBC_01245]|uniref:hypothetical protein n=1 Tax=Kribbella sp. NBC_01245 TaxID=2903578 RepID=UPI002E29C011|nr:hypothetical protein [Kribbella sp. NBC_01245]